MNKKILVLLFWIVLVLGTAVTTVLSKGEATCASGVQAGVQEFVFEGSRQIVPVKFVAVCGKAGAVPVATGDEAVEAVQVGFVTPTRVDFVVTGTAGTTGRLYWQVSPMTSLP